MDWLILWPGISTGRSIHAEQIDRLHLAKRIAFVNADLGRRFISRISDWKIRLEVRRVATSHCVDHRRRH